jgi:hypothetical protein
MDSSGTSLGRGFAVASRGTHPVRPEHPTPTVAVVADGSRDSADRRRERKLRRKLKQAREQAAALQADSSSHPETSQGDVDSQLLDTTLAEVDGELASEEALAAVRDQGSGAPVGELERQQLASLHEDVERLARSNFEKDGLITALTDRLEQAAEQLDRLRRSGADRGWRGGGGAGLPPELIQDQRTAIEDLKESIERWEGMQAGLTLGRMEMQLGELRDLVVALGANHTSGQGHTARGESRHTSHTAPVAPRIVPATPAGAAGSASWWERQKALMLGDEIPEGDAHSSGPLSAPVAAPEQAADDVSEIPRLEVAASLCEWVLPEEPTPVDWDQLTLESARQAILERDQLIESLREPLLLAKMAGVFAGGVGLRDALPPEQQQRLAQLESVWEGRFRKQELELSIERARLAREQMTVRQQQEATRKELLRLKEGGETDTVEQKQERRWFRFMNQADGTGKGSR